MTKVLIADDEMYVRQMMSTIVDWKAYRMELVGEASSGQAVLEILQRQSVDLLITDLSMPGMDPRTYLRQLRQENPQLFIIVLTMHQEFELVQEALRLGIDDYIAKVQIDRKTFGDLLRKSLDKLDRRLLDFVAASDTLDVVFHPAALITTHAKLFRLLHINETIDKNDIFLHVTGARGVSYTDLYVMLHELYAKLLFYTLEPDTHATTVDLRTRDQLPAPGKLKVARRNLEETMGTSDWILDSNVFYKCLSVVPQLCIPMERLPAFFYKPMHVCAAYTGITPVDYFDLVEQFRWWHEWIKWLHEVRNSLTPFMKKNSNIANIIQIAVSYINDHYSEPMMLNDMLRKTALSKSYFSAYFKEYTGHTFGNYIKKIRIEQSKKYLLETGWNIDQIAEKVGYANERTFRKAFQQLTSQSPTAYRKSKLR